MAETKATAPSTLLSLNFAGMNFKEIEATTYRYTNIHKYKNKIGHCSYI